MSSAKQSDKISDIVKLKRMLKKWRNQATSGTTTTTTNNVVKKSSISRSNSIDNNYEVKKKGSVSRSNSIDNNQVKKKGSLSRSNSMKGISFLKRTLSFTDLSTNWVSSNAVPKGYLAVHVGEEMKRFVIPTNYLKHECFCSLLKEAENEFGFQQEGVLKIPCEVEVFENILMRVEVKKNLYDKEAHKYSRIDGVLCSSIESKSLATSHHTPSPMCR